MRQKHIVVMVMVVAAALAGCGKKERPAANAPAPARAWGSPGGSADVVTINFDSPPRGHRWGWHSQRYQMGLSVNGALDTLPAPH